MIKTSIDYEAGANAFSEAPRKLNLWYTNHKLRPASAKENGMADANEDLQGEII